MTKILPVIMAGGSGTRLWPLSRENYPKQFIKIFGDKSLLQLCIKRNKEFGKVIIIVGNEHRFTAESQAKEVCSNFEIIIEPEGKNTAPCAIISSLIGNKYNSSTILLLPADHYINNIDNYSKVIKDSIESSKKSSVTTIGIKPSTTHTGYGYIKCGSAIGPNFFSVEKFVEKPNQELALEYFSSGNYFWNSGMFIFSPDSMLSLCKNLVPEMLKTIEASYNNAKKDLDFLRLGEEYTSIKADSIDYAIMEKADNVGLSIANFGWNDLGSFSSIWEISEKDPYNNALSGDIYSIDSSNNYIYSKNKLTATVGVSDLIIVNTEDATLVCTKEKAEEVKKIVTKLHQDKRNEAKNSAICYRPWGSYQTVDEGPFHKVKRIIVTPHHKLSLQYHNRRAEHWVVVEGIAEVHVGDETHILKENDSIYIPKLVKHRLANIGEVDLHLIEVQTGDYLGEDDIVRLTDIYGRN